MLRRRSSLSKGRSSREPPKNDGRLHRHRRITVLTVLTWHADAMAAMLTLTWTDNSTDELGFAIDRRLGTTGAFGEIATTGPGVTTYVDATLADATTYCYRVRAFNGAGYSDYSGIACGTTPQVFGLAVLRMGAGSGTVTSAPIGITCGASCSSIFPSGTAVTLTASAASGSIFTGWGGGGCSGTGTCVVTVSAAMTVTANFAQLIPLTISKAGTGTGTVTSAPAGINCGPTCSSNFPSGGSVTLSASPAPGSTFSGWSGGGCSGTGSCSVTLSATTTVTATFTAQTVALSINKAGAGAGTVTSSPAGINCGGTCSSLFPINANVTLSASSTPGSTFSGWSGGGCSGTGTCLVALSAATSVTATFALQPVALTVAKAGAGMGTVTSAPAGINCGSTCTSNFPSGSIVTLSAGASAGSTFSGWGGGCSGTGQCSVSLSAATIVTATFALQPASLTVNRAGTGSGSVTSAPSGIDCGTTCSGSYPSGTITTLTAVAGSGSIFTGWSGAGCSGTGACVVTLSAPTTLTATFAAQSPTLTVALLGSGNGTVTSTPNGIACGSICVSTFLSGTPVTLLAAPGPGSSFAGWSGGGCTGAGICITTVAGTTSVNATFDLAPSTSFSDNFLRDVESTFLGMGWTEPQGDFFIRNRSLRNGTERTRHLAVQSVLTMAIGQVTAEFTSLSNNAAPAFGLVFGFVDPRNYHAAYRQVGGSALLKIVRVTDGVETVLAQRSCGNPVRGLKFDLAVSISSNQVVLTGAGRTLTATGIPATTGKVGVMVAGGGTSHIVDDFQAGP